MSPWTLRSGMRPAPRPTYGRRALLIAGLAGSLTFGSVVGIGFLASDGERNTSVRSENLLAFTVPSDDWAAGAEQTWSTTIDTNASVLTAGDYLFAVAPSTDANAALTAYRLEGDNEPTRLWSTSVDTSADGAVRPSFLAWGNTTLVHGTTLYDMETGSTSEAPWSAQHTVVMAHDTAIACDTSDSCSGYPEGSTTAAWSSVIPDASSGLSSAEVYDINVSVRPTGRFAIVGFHSAVNLDTGEVITVNVPMPDWDGYALASTTDGWAVHARTASGEVEMYSYGPDGGDPVDSYTDTSGFSQSQVPVYRPVPRSSADFKALWTEGDMSFVLGITTPDDNNCIPSVEITNHGTITLPTALGDESSTCFTTVRISLDGKVMTAGTAEPVDLSTFNLMYDAASGEQISFPGLDPNTGAVFEQVTETSVVGYDPATGSLIGYRPA